MSDYDYNNLPSGVGPIDAQNMGITPYDDRQVAYAKLATHQLSELLSRPEGGDQFASGSQQAVSYSSRSTPSAVNPSSLAKLHGYYDTRPLSNVIEYNRKKLADERNERTRRLKEISKTLLITAVASFVLMKPIISNRIPFLYVFLDILPGRFLTFASLVSGIYFGLKYIKENRKLIAEEEGDWTARGTALAKALSAECKIKKNKKPYGLMGKYDIPRISLHPELVHQFNKNYKAITGKELPYVVYQVNVGPDAGTIGLIEREKNIKEWAAKYGALIEPDDVLSLTRSKDGEIQHKKGSTKNSA